jgi:hypothetical protein
MRGSSVTSPAAERPTRRTTPPRSARRSLLAVATTFKPQNELRRCASGTWRVADCRCRCREAVEPVELALSPDGKVAAVLAARNDPPAAL